MSGQREAKLLWEELRTVFVSWLLGKRTCAGSEKTWFLSFLNGNREPDLVRSESLGSDGHLLVLAV